MPPAGECCCLAPRTSLAGTQVGASRASPTRVTSIGSSGSGASSRVNPISARTSRNRARAPHRPARRRRRLVLGTEHPDQVPLPGPRSARTARSRRPTGRAGPARSARRARHGARVYQASMNAGVSGRQRRRRRAADVQAHWSPSTGGARSISLAAGRRTAPEFPNSRRKREPPRRADTMTQPCEFFNLDVLVPGEAAGFVRVPL